MVLTGYSSPVVLAKQKQQKLHMVCTDFRVLNDKQNKKITYFYQ